MGGAISTPNELVLTFGGLHLCVQFGENPQRNATVRVTTYGQTDRHTDRQTQTDFIICFMLYAIAMEQITVERMCRQDTNAVQNCINKQRWT